MAMIRINIENINSIAIKQQTLKSNLSQIKENIRSNKNGLDFEISKRASISNSFDNLYTKVDFISRDIEKLESILNLTVSQYTEAESKIKANIYNNFGNIHNKKSCSANILKQKFINNNIFEQLSNLNVDNVFINESDNDNNVEKSLFQKIWDFGKGVVSNIDDAREYSSTALAVWTKELGNKLGDIRFELRDGKYIIFGSHESRINANINPHINRINPENIAKNPNLNKVFKTSQTVDKLDEYGNFLEGWSSLGDKISNGLAVVDGFSEIFSKENEDKDYAHVMTDVAFETTYNLADIAVSSAVQSAVTAGIGGKIGTVVGGAIGSVIPGAGTVVGAVVGTAVGMAAGAAVSKFIDWASSWDFDKDGKGIKDEIKDGLANGASSVVNWTKNLFNKGNGNGKLNLAM